MKHLKVFSTESEVDFNIMPNVAYIRDTKKVLYNPYDPINTPLYFEALEDTTFQFTKVLEYSTDSVSWTELPAATATPMITIGQRIYFRANSVSGASEGLGKFSSTGQFNAGGNPLSLRSKTTFGSINSASAHQFKYLFQNCIGLVDASRLSLHCTTLNNQCYASMFEGCKNLINAPLVLPAGSLYSTCYASMFKGCKNLINAPEIRASRGADRALEYMFQSCSNLKYIKALISGTDISYTYFTNGVAQNGVFVKKTGSVWKSGTSGIPSSWTVKSADI